LVSAYIPYHGGYYLSSGSDFVLRLPMHLSKNYSAEERISAMLEFVHHISKALEEQQLQSPDSLQEFILHISPSLKVKITDRPNSKIREVIIRDDTTKTRILTLELDEVGRLVRPQTISGYWTLDRLCKNRAPLCVKLYEDEKYSYYHVVANRPKYNILRNWQKIRSMG